MAWIFNEIRAGLIQSLRQCRALATIFGVWALLLFGIVSTPCFISPADQNPMSDLLQLELTDRQRELLLRGLRFVRSSRMLEIRESSDITDDQRKGELGELHQLAEMLGKDAAKPTRG